MEYSVLGQLETEKTITNIPRDIRQRCKPVQKKEPSENNSEFLGMKNNDGIIKSQKKKKERGSWADLSAKQNTEDIWKVKTWVLEKQPSYPNIKKP